MANRTAIVVVAGVGDEGSGEGAERIVEGLLRHGGWSAGEEVTEWYPVAGDILDATDHEARARSARRFTVHRPAGGQGPPEVDVYEFWWADLSRFPAALRSFVAAFLGLFLDMPAIARAALLGGLAIGRSSVPPVAKGPQETSVGMRSRLAAAGLLRTVGWLCAVPIMITTFLALALVGLMTLALYLRSLGAPLLGWCLAIAAGGLIVCFASVMAASRYQRSGPRLRAAPDGPRAGRRRGAGGVAHRGPGRPPGPRPGRCGRGHGGVPVPDPVAHAPARSPRSPSSPCW